jgi:hypothetical protein
MRFMSMVRIDENSGLVPSEQLMRDMGKLIAEMSREGVLISTAGLRPTAEGVRVRQRGGSCRRSTGRSLRPRRWSAASRSSRRDP